MTWEKISVYIKAPIEIGTRLAGWQSGSCRGLQILVHRFNSGTGLQNSFLPHILFRLSSAVEQSAVNRLVACSNQAAGAIKKDLPCGGLFLWLRIPCREQRLPGKSLFPSKSPHIGISYLLFLILCYKFLPWGCL